MAAITSTIIAGAGIALSAGQAIKANKEKKAADEQAVKAEAAMRGVKEQNMMKQQQVPTLGYDLAKESQAQRDVSTISALQGAGAAGVIGGIGKVAQAGAAADLQLAAQAEQAQFKRDTMQSQAAMGIEQRRAGREFNIEASQLAGAQAASQAAQAQQNQAVQGIFSGLLGAAGSLQTGIQAGQMEGNYLDNLGSLQNSNAIARRYTNTTTQ
mgnify:CR=1 FL=1|tara:strand:+ start:1183 stop:1818 length:636 start_codon:yes stop_codon:yes gene_type:complete